MRCKVCGDRTFQASGGRYNPNEAWLHLNIMAYRSRGFDLHNAVSVSDDEVEPGKVALWMQPSSGSSS